jgi:hypothetical protein
MHFALHRCPKTMNGAQTASVKNGLDPSAEHSCPDAATALGAALLYLKYA